MGIWSSLFARKQQPGFSDFSILGTDIHSHVIPGIDDGSASLEDSMEMISGMAALGYKRLITTPHIMVDYYRNSRENIFQGLELLRGAVKEAGIDITLEAAAEYMLDDGFAEKLAKRELLTFAQNHVLIELSTFSLNPNLHALLFELQLSGYRAVLAHAERYSYWFENLSYYEDLRDREVLIQVNLLSFGDYYSPSIRKTAVKLAEAGLIDLLGSDLHHVQSIPLYTKVLQSKVLQQLLASGRLKNGSPSWC